MGVFQKFRNGQLVGAARQAVAAAGAGAGIDLFPPVTCTSDQVVSLLAKPDQVMTDGKIAEAQEIGDGNLVGAGQAGLALMALVLAQSHLALLMQLSQSGLLFGCERS